MDILLLASICMTPVRSPEISKLAHIGAHSIAAVFTTVNNSTTPTPQRKLCHFLRWFHTYLFPWRDRYPPDTVGVRRVAIWETRCRKVSCCVLQGLPTCCTSKTTTVIQADTLPIPEAPCARPRQHPVTSQSPRDASVRSVSVRLMIFFWLIEVKIGSGHQRAIPRGC